MKLLEEVVRLKNEGQIALNCSDAQSTYSKIKGAVIKHRKARGEKVKIGEVRIVVDVGDFSLPCMDDDPSDSGNYVIIVKDYKGNVIKNVEIYDLEVRDEGDYSFDDDDDSSSW